MTATSPVTMEKGRLRETKNGRYDVTCTHGDMCYTSQILDMDG